MKSRYDIFSKISSCLEDEPGRAKSGRPYVTLSYAQSIDGSIAYRPGRPLALSCEDSLVFTHRLRSIHQGILVGIGTVLADNPYLTVRHVQGKNPQPIVVDGRLRFPLDAHALKNQRIPWIATSERPDAEREQVLMRSGVKILRIPSNSNGLIDLAALLRRLIDMRITSLMVEGGAEIIISFLKHQLVDQLVLTISPVYIGGMHAVWPLQINLSNPPVLRNMEWEPCGSDVILRADMVWNEQ